MLFLPTKSCLLLGTSAFITFSSKSQSRGGQTAKTPDNISSYTIVTVSFITGANNNSSFIINDGTMWSCGDNSFGQLGVKDAGTVITHRKQVGDDRDWLAVTPGAFHTLAIKKDGTLWSWGDNQYGQLGDGTRVNKTVPVQSGNDNNWESIATADYQSYAIRKDGTLWAWGVNNYGQLGIEKINDFIIIPVQVGTDKDWIKVVAGSFHALGLKKDGSLWAWGYNGYGQLGIGETTSATRPVQVGNQKDWLQVAASAFHSLAIKNDGTLWSWGDNEEGVLGTGDSYKQISPVKIESSSKWKIVSAGFHHTAAIKEDGSLWVWGTNFSGELGLGYSGGNSLLPVQLGTEKNWKHISLGYSHTLALKKDGSQWVWGENEYGQLGTGGFAATTSPVKISCRDEWTHSNTREPEFFRLTNFTNAETKKAKLLSLNN